MVFQHLKEANLNINLSKCQFFKKHLHYLAHLISKQGIQLLLEKEATIKMLEEPSNVDELHHFLGLTGYYRRFVPLFANITMPLNKLLRRDTKLHWSPHCQVAFEHLKQALCKEPILQYPSMEKCTCCSLMQVITHIWESSPRKLKLKSINKRQPAFFANIIHVSQGCCP